MRKGVNATKLIFVVQEGLKCHQAERLTETEQAR
jgi:hypothetical protein